MTNKPLHVYRVTVWDLDNIAKSRVELAVVPQGAPGLAMATTAVPAERWIRVEAEDRGLESAREPRAGVVYLAGLNTQNIVEANQDDYDWLLEVEASPQGAWPTTCFNENYRTRLKKEMYRELLEECGKEDLRPEEVTWVERPWTNPEVGRPCKVMEAYVGRIRPGCPDGMVVVQEFELIGGERDTAHRATHAKDRVETLTVPACETASMEAGLEYLMDQPGEVSLEPYIRMCLERLLEELRRVTGLKTG